MSKLTRSTTARWRRAWLSSLVFVFALSALQPVAADEADARRLFKAMTEYIENQKTLTFDYDDVLEVVTDDGQKLQITASGSVNLKRPNKLTHSHHGGFADLLMTFDGKNVSVLGKRVNVYAQMEIPGTVDNLIDELRLKHGRPLPAADLLLSDAYEAMMADVTDVRDLGAGVVGGEMCDSLAFSTEEIDWQIWIAQGDQPYPCRFVITSRLMEGAPQYSIQLRNWKAGVDLPDSIFGFTNMTNASQVDLVELVIDLPENMVKGEPQ